MSTTLTLTPELHRKTGKSDNRVAVGEKVVVTAKGLGEYADKLRLRIRFANVDCAVFPLADTDAWTQTGTDDEDAQCVIDLNTAELRHATRFIGDLGVLSCLAVLDTGVDTTVQNVFCSIPVTVGNWLPLTGLPDPIAMTDWKTRCAEIEAALNEHKDDSDIHVSASDRSRWDNPVGEENVIEVVKVNGAPLTPDADKAVDVLVPEDAEDFPSVLHTTTPGATLSGDIMEHQNVLSALASHTTDTSNPHSVTKEQVGLGDVDNTSDLNKPISTATQTALDGKMDVERTTDAVDAVMNTADSKQSLIFGVHKTGGASYMTVVNDSGSGIVKIPSPDNDDELALKSSVDDVSNEVSGKMPKVPSPTSGNAVKLDSSGNVVDAGIAMPNATGHGVTDTLVVDTNLGTAAYRDIPSSGNATSQQVVLGSDTRLTNARTPTPHAATHATGGSDSITPSSIGAADADHTHEIDDVEGLLGALGAIGGAVGSLQEYVDAAAGALQSDIASKADDLFTVSGLSNPVPATASRIYTVAVTTASQSVSVALPTLSDGTSLTIEFALIVASGASVGSVSFTVGGTSQTATWLDTPTWTAGKTNGLAVRLINIGGTYTLLANKYGEW